MIEEGALVESIDGDYAWLHTQRQSSCGACSARNGCGVSVIDRLTSARAGPIRAINRAQAMPGDQVIVGISEGALLQGSAAVYLSPLIGLFAGAGLAEGLAPFNTLTAVEPTSIVLAILGLAGGLLYLQRYTQRRRQDPRFQPVVLRTVPPVTTQSIPTPIAQKKGPGLST